MISPTRPPDREPAVRLCAASSHAFMRDSEPVGPRLSLLKLKLTVAKLVRLSDVATGARADIGAIASHDATVEAEQNPVLPVDLGRVIDFDLKRSVGSDA